VDEINIATYYDDGYRVFCLVLQFPGKLGELIVRNVKGLRQNPIPLMSRRNRNLSLT